MNKSDITAVILAGGRGRRMGGFDKGLINFLGQPIIEHTLAAITPQCGAVIINANRNIEQYARYQHPVISDQSSDFQGPLAGFSAAMEHSSSSLVATIPCDAPIIPKGLIKRLLTALKDANADIAVAHDGSRLQPVYALIKTQLLDNLKAFIANGDRKIDLWYAQNTMVEVDFSDIPYAFKNINTPEQKTEMEQSC